MQSYRSKRRVSFQWRTKTKIRRTHGRRLAVIRNSIIRIPECCFDAWRRGLDRVAGQLESTVLSGVGDPEFGT